MGKWLGTGAPFKKVCHQTHSSRSLCFWVIRGGDWGGNSQPSCARSILWSFLRLGVTAKYQFTRPSLVGKCTSSIWMAGELLEHRTGSQSRCHHSQARSQTHVQAISQEADKNMCLDPAFPTDGISAANSNHL